MLTQIEDSQNPFRLGNYWILGFYWCMILNTPKVQCSKFCRVKCLVRRSSEYSIQLGKFISYRFEKSLHIMYHSSVARFRACFVVICGFRARCFHHFQPSGLLGTQWEETYLFYHPTVPPMPGRHGRADCHDSFCYHRLWCCLRQRGQRFVQSFASGLGFWHGHLGLGLFDWTPLWWPDQLRCDLVFGCWGGRFLGIRD